MTIIIGLLTILNFLERIGYMENAAANFGSSVNTALTTSVNPNQLADQFVEILPWVGLMVVVAFVIYEVRKLVKGAGKGKVRL